MHEESLIIKLSVYNAPAYNNLTINNIMHDFSDTKQYDSV